MKETKKVINPEDELKIGSHTYTKQDVPGLKMIIKHFEDMEEWNKGLEVTNGMEKREDIDIIEKTNEEVINDGNTK